MCAHAVRVAVQKIDGVQEVEVSLNDGYADITLAPHNAVTIQQIQQLVRNNGFTPRETHIRVRGTITLRAGVLELLVSGSLESFAVTGTEQTLTRLRADSGRTVTLVGWLPEPTGGVPVSTLHVTDVVHEQP